MYVFQISIYSIFQGGRKMKPEVELMLSGLNKQDLFDIILEFVLIGNDKYTVSNGEWTVKKDAAEPFNGGNLIKLFYMIFSGL